MLPNPRLVPHLRVAAAQANARKCPQHLFQRWVLRSVELGTTDHVYVIEVRESLLFTVACTVLAQTEERHESIHLLPALLAQTSVVVGESVLPAIRAKVSVARAGKCYGHGSNGRGLRTCQFTTPTQDAKLHRDSGTVV